MLISNSRGPVARALFGDVIQFVDFILEILTSVTGTEARARALDEAIRDGRIKRGQHLLLEAFGGGFAWASALVRY